MAEKLIGSLKQGQQTLNLYESTDRNPEIYIDGAQGVMAAGQTLKVNLFTRHMDMDTNPQVENRYVACRLVMGVDTFFSLVDFLNSTAEQMKKDFKITANRQNS